MESDKTLRRIAYIVILVLAINGIFSFWSWFRSNNLIQAVDKLNTASATIDSLQGQLGVASDNVDSIKQGIKNQLQLIRALDEEVSINYEQINARFNQENWDARQRELERVDSLREANNAKIDSIFSTIYGQ